MKIGSLALGSIVLLASLSFGEDMLRAAPADRQFLKTCVDRQLSNSPVTLSKAEAKRYCRDELKRQKEAGAGPEQQPRAPPAPSDSPAPAMPPPG